MSWKTDSDSGEMMVFDTWQGAAANIPFDDYQWIKKLSGKVWCRLFDKIPSLIDDYNLPIDYDLYVISFHLEAIDIHWLDRVTQKTKKPIIVLGDGFDISYPVGSNITIYPYLYWHRQLAKAQTYFPNYRYDRRTITHKTSAICNRITQSKLLITTALLEYMNDSSIIRLSDWAEDKNLHFRQPTGNATLDNLSDIFYKKYLGKEILIDDFNNERDNFQVYTMNPNVPYLQNVGLHFTNETLAYSFMQENNKEFIYPGPFLTEKTLKCLLSGTAFVPVGQYHTLSALARLGLRFDYPFDLSWDQDPGNLSRLESLINLIKHLAQFDANDIHDMVKESEQYNFDHVWSGSFSRACMNVNKSTEQMIIDQFG